MLARHSFKPSFEFLLNEFRTRRGLYLLGAGASAGEVPFGESFMMGPALDYLRNSGSFPADIPIQSELNKKIIRIASPLLISRLFPDRDIRDATDFPYQELLRRLPNFHARFYMKHTLATARYSGRQSESYRVFRAFRQSLILNYNLDGLASELCGKRHGVIAMHGTVDREYGSAKSAALLPHLREFDLPVTNDDILMCVPEDYGDAQLARRWLTALRFRPDFIAIIGYSFGRNGDKYDDCVSLDFLRSQFREFSGSVYVIDPQPETLGEMIADGLKCQRVSCVRAYWNVLAHVFVQILRGNFGDRSINYRCEQLLDQYGSGIAFPRLGG
jgi:hypothetical protein